MLIIVTRPLHQAQNLCSQLNRRGVETIVFPTIDIVLPDRAAYIQQALSQYLPQKIIFASTNAVKPVTPHLNAAIRPKLYAIGPATAAALQHHQLSAIIPQNEQFTSEGLAALSDFQNIAGENILIFSGEGGSNLLTEVLNTRGARVIKIPVYKRALPTVNTTQILAHWRTKTIDYIVTSSIESLNNLYTLVEKKNREWLCQQRLIVISKAMAHSAKQLGFKQKLLIAANASDQAVVETIMGLGSKLIKN